MTVRPPPGNDSRPGFPPTREDIFWVEAMRRVVFDSMTGMQRVATIIIALSGAGLLGYLAWLLSPWALSRGVGWPGRVFLLLPAVIWVVAIVHGALVFQVRRYRYFANSPDSSRLAFRRINRKRGEYLTRALIWWLAGIMAVLLIVIIS